MVNNNQLKKNIGVLMLMKPLSLFLSFIYIPLVLHYLGDEKYGVWVIILDIVSWINYFDIGIGNGLRNKLSESYALKDDNASKRYISSAYIMAAIISLVFFVVLTIVWRGLKLSHFFRLDCTNENVDSIVFISVFFVGLNFVLGLSRIMAYAIQRPAILGVFDLLGQVMQIVSLCVVGFLTNGSLTITAVLYGSVCAVTNFFIYIYITKRNQTFVPRVRYFDSTYVKPMLTLGLGFFVLQISTLVLNSTDNLLITRLFGTANVTPYSIVYKVFHLIVQVQAIIIIPMWSAYTEAVAQRDLLWIKEMIVKINRITYFFSVGIMVGVFAFKPLARIWLGKDLDYGKGLIILTAFYMIMQMFANNYSSVLCGVGHIKYSIIIAIVETIMNIPLSCFFALNLNLGLRGIMLGSICVMLISFIALPIITKKWISRKEMEWKVDS